jgi:hypothetical protein
VIAVLTLYKGVTVFVINQEETERCGLMVNIPSYFGGPGFKSRPGDLLS